MTPRRRSSSVSDARATYAPRILKAPIGWSDSAFRYLRSAAGPKGMSGVRVATPRSVSAARRIASMPTSAGSPLRLGTAASGSAATADDPLAVDAVGCPRQRGEPVRPDLLAASGAHAERSVVDPAERPLDRGELDLVALAQGEVSL